jgi:RNA polymerase sigma-70 factor, ECF subfamily
MARRSDDAVLVDLVRRGSSEAVARLYELYYPVAWKAAYAVALDRALADDVAQEAMERALGSLGAFDDERPLAPWIRRIAVNRALDELRRDRRLAGRPPAEEELPRWREDAGEVHVAVAEAVAALAPERRVVVVLHYWLDYTLQEIADALALPIGTVSSRLSRARAELRDAMKEEENAA